MTKQRINLCRILGLAALVFGGIWLSLYNRNSESSSATHSNAQPPHSNDCAVCARTNKEVSGNEEGTILAHATTGLSSSPPLPPQTEIDEKRPIYLRKRELDISPTLQRLEEKAFTEPTSTVRFELFEDVVLTGTVTHIEQPGADRTVVSGQWVDIPGDFILAANANTVVATFHTPTLGLFQIRPIASGRHAAIELDPAALPTCDGAIRAVPSSTDSSGERAAGRARDQLIRMAASGTLSPSVEGGDLGGFGQQGGTGHNLEFTEIDVLIVYTPAAAADLGGQAGMQALIDMTFARANSAFVNSEVGIRLRPVRVEEAAYTETDISTALSNVQQGTGALENVPQWRDESGADLVSLFTTHSGGLAYLYSGGVNSADFGFSVVGVSNAEATFIHEIGHNLGLEHDRENKNTSGDPLYSYAFGWRFTPANAPELRTIMAYAPGVQIPYFSNPDVTYMGTPTGVPIGEEWESNNAQALRNTKASIAQYRSATGSIPPDITLLSPDYEARYMARDSVVISAEATDSDGEITTVHFYRLKSDNVYGFSNFESFYLGDGATPPFSVTESHVPAGFWTYGAIAYDDAGLFGVDTVSVVVAPHYRRRSYPLPPSKTRARIEAMNEAGRFVGFGHNGNESATDTQAAYWEDGDVTLLPPLPDDEGARALAVDSIGVVYGKSISTSGDKRAVRWHNESDVEDISGWISGYTAEAAIGVDEAGRVYFKSDTGYRRFDGPGYTAAGLNERWTKVTGNGLFATGHDYDFTSAAWQAMRWNDAGTRLPPLPGYQSSWGQAVNRSGAVLGVSSPANLSWSSETARITYWPAESISPQDVGTLGATGGWVQDLNDFGHGVGAANDSEAGGQAFVWKGTGELLNLNELLLAESGILRSAAAINNRGEIIATGFSGSTAIIQRLTPLPGLDHQYWLARHFSPAELEDQTLTDDMANPAGDGMPNIVKRALGLNPNVAFDPLSGPSPAPSLAIEDGHVYIRYHRLRFPGDLTYHPEGTDELVNNNWTGAHFEPHAISALDQDFEEVTLRSVSPASALDTLFFRLRLSRD